MKDFEIHYFGILANVDSSILQLELDKGFEIKKQSIQGMVKFVSKIENSSEDTILGNFFKNGISKDEDDNLYYIHNSYFSAEEDFHASSLEFGPKIRYIYQLFRKLKLFKDGNSHISLIYEYYCDKGKFQILTKVLGANYHINKEILHLEKSEIPVLKSFLDDIELEFNYDYLEFAFKNFELSYQVHDSGLRFLTLMNGIEALFNPSGGGELTFRISRSVAVFLGQYKDDSEKIEKNVKELYKKRSKIVHYGSANISDDDLVELRSYLRQSIIGFYELNEDKDSILKKLNALGFGDSPISL